MVIALLLAAQVAGAETLATCRPPGDPQQRSWSLVRREGRLIVVFRSKTLDKPQVELPITGAQAITNNSSISVSFASANGGRAVQWRIVDGLTRLDLRVNHGLEVNVEPDLDPAVDLMNTDGELLVLCDLVRPPKTVRVEDSLRHDVVRAPAQEASPKEIPVEHSPAQPDSPRPADSLAHNVAPPPLKEESSEFVVAAGVASSVNLFQSTSGRSYAVQTIGWGRDLTPEWGPGALRGRFVWAVEAMPVFAQFSPNTIYGIGFAPVVWRWNFVPRPRWSWFAELSMGGMWSTQAIPEGTSRGNFTAHWGAGVRLGASRPHAWSLAYRFQHFSNGNQLGSNPGVNAHVVLAGWSYRR